MKKRSKKYCTSSTNWNRPVWALLAGVVLAGESIGAAGIAGAVLIVSASYAGQAIERRHRRSSIEQTGRAGAAVPDGLG